MRGFLAVVSREIHERLALLAAAAVASVLPLLAPLLPATGSNPPADIREAVMWVMVVCLVPIFALLLGVGFIGRDLSEGRLGFFFAQPLSGPTIWFGKLAAVAVLVTTAQLLIMLPTAGLAPEPAKILQARWVLDSGVADWLVSVVFWLGPLIVILTAHALGIMWRSRSAWIVGDLIAFLVVGGVAWLALSPLLVVAPLASFIGFVGWLGSWTVIGLLVAGAVQVTAGRTDLQRGHRALSISLWSTLAAAAVVLLGWSWWARSATPSDLDFVGPVAVGSGKWIAVSGSSTGRLDYHPGFLVNIEDGRWVDVGSFERSYYGANLGFSADMSRAVWARSTGIGEWTLIAASLADDRPVERTTGIVLTSWPEDLALSPGGRLASVIQDRTVSVYDLDGAELLAAVRITGEYVPRWARFADADHLAIEARTPWGRSDQETQYTTFHFDVVRRRLSAPEPPRDRWLAEKLEDDEGSALRLAETLVDGENHLAVIEDASGEVITDLGPTVRRWEVRTVGDDRLLVIFHGRDHHRIVVIEPDGRELLSTEIEAAGWLYAGGEISPGEIVLGSREWVGSGESPKYYTMVFDLSTGAVTRNLQGFAPVLGDYWAITSVGAWHTGSPASRMLLDERGQLHVWNPDSGETRQVVPFPS